jgi:hypothetical protein
VGTIRTSSVESPNLLLPGLFPKLINHDLPRAANVKNRRLEAANFALSGGTAPNPATLSIKAENTGGSLPPGAPSEDINFTPVLTKDP